MAVLVGASVAENFHDNLINELEKTKKVEVAATTKNPTTTEVPTTTPAWQNPKTCIGKCPQLDPENVVQLPNRDCNRFCKCSNGLAYVMSCPPGLHYSKLLQVCTWPYEASCTESTQYSEVQIMEAVKDLFDTDNFENDFKDYSDNYLK